MPDNFTKATFAGHVGETFRIRGGSQALEVELIEISGLDKEEPRPFSLLFRNAGEQHLPQGTYRFEHDGMGTFELFLVPVGPDGERTGMLHESVFN